METLSTFDSTHFDATVRSIEQIVEEDVEMKGLASQPEIFLVLDTNVLLSNFDVIKQFTADIEALSAPLIIIIPSAVLSELDGQKNRPKLAWFARRASTWILERVKEHKCVKGQTHDEQFDRARPNHDPDRKNDLSILDCCLFFRYKRGIQGFLVSGDKNLCIEAESREIPTVQPSGDWSSQDMAKRMFPQSPHLSKFTGYRAPYRPKSKVGYAAKAAPKEDDGMDVDDDAAAVGDFLPPSHALDSLHLQVIEHFGSLLRNLVLRAGDPTEVQGPTGGAPLSKYAPAYARKHCLNWTAAECLQYLLSKKRLPGPASRPPVDVFCTVPYSGKGARRGQDWSKRDWEVALGDLGRVGEEWGEGGVGESLAVLGPHVAYVFSMPLKPTGM